MILLPISHYLNYTFLCWLGRMYIFNLRVKGVTRTGTILCRERQFRVLVFGTEYICSLLDDNWIDSMDAWLYTWATERVSKFIASHQYSAHMSHGIETLSVWPADTLRWALWRLYFGTSLSPAYTVSILGEFSDFIKRSWHVGMVHF